jgi:hypothetical protein
MKQWHKELRPETVDMPGKQRDIFWGSQTDHQAGDRQAGNWIFCEDLKNECYGIMEEGPLPK